MAVPPLFRFTVPKVVAPFLNVIVPVGVPAPGDVGVTVAVNEMGCPNTEVDMFELKRIVVEALLTTWLNVKVEVAKLVLPLYVARIVCVATLNADVVMAATPELFNVAIPIWVVPSKNVTVPEGIPADEETVALNVTACPKTEGVPEVVNEEIVVAAVLTV